MDNKVINTLRFLGVEIIAKANSGHPGIVLGAAPMIETLFTRHLRIDSDNNEWINRDRFVLSAGHGSALLYAMLHLSKFDVTIEDLKQFRQIGNTPGHPEYGHTDGVETTSGPLGQGIANAVGMAMAEAHLASKFNEDGYSIIDHDTYVLCGDGDLQEGVALEALSLAGHLKLNKLIILFDSNKIQLDGAVNLSYSENHKLKFEAMGFNYLTVEDGMNVEHINRALSQAKQQNEKPTFIEIKTTIGFGTDVAGTSQAHGKPLNEKQIKDLKQTLNWNLEPFEVPEDVYEYCSEHIVNRGHQAYTQWVNVEKAYKEKFPEKHSKLKKYFNQIQESELDSLFEIKFDNQEATRVSGGKVIERASKILENMIGGSADLASSTKAKGLDGDFISDHYSGRNINFGVREHAMGAIVNGMTLHQGLKVFSGAFFVFSDYMKPAIRLAAIMRIPSIFVMTHDSIAVGEDGPTHQPVEQLAGLRAIPFLNVIRPANGIETASAFKSALIAKDTPTVIVLSRQNITPTTGNIDGAQKGAYIISKEKNKLDGILLATGTEVGLAVEAQAELYNNGKDVRVVSMPSMFMFEKQDNQYKNDILPHHTKILAIEAAHPMPWYKYTPNIIGIETFGASADGDLVMKKYQFTTKHIVERFNKI
jgi:transketolase